MGLFADIGRTNTLGNASATLLDQALRIREGERTEAREVRRDAIVESEQALRMTQENRALAMDEVKMNVYKNKLETEKAEVERANKPIPIDVLSQGFKYTALAEYAKGVATRYGFINTEGPVPFIRAADVKEMAEVLAKTEHKLPMAQIQLDTAKDNLLQSKQALEQYMGSAQGKDLSKDKNLPVLQEGLKKAYQELQGALELHDQIVTEGKKSAEMPYKVGQLVNFRDPKTGKPMQGVFQGLDPTNRAPIFSDQVAAPSYTGTAQDAYQRLKDKIDAIEKVEGRKLTPEERRLVTLHDPWGIYGGSGIPEGAGKTPANADEFMEDIQDLLK